MYIEELQNLTAAMRIINSVSAAWASACGRRNFFLHIGQLSLDATSVLIHLNKKNEHTSKKSKYYSDSPEKKKKDVSQDKFVNVVSATLRFR